MTTRKHFGIFGALTLLLAVCLPFAVHAAAPTTSLTQSTTASLVNVPTSIAASTTATNTEVVDVRTQDDLFVQISARNVSTNASAALTIPIHRSIDGTTFETTAFTTLSISLDGALTRTWCTNINVGSARYLLFNRFGNATTNIATNITVTISAKPPWTTFVSPTIQ